MPFRSFISHAVLVLVPIISLIIAILPYWWIRKKYQPVAWKHLWLAFLFGLFGNLVWWLIVINIPSGIANYILGVSFSAAMFGVITYGLFIAALPYVSYRLRHDKCGIKRLVLFIILGVVIILIEIVLGSFLFILGWGLAANSFLGSGGILESSSSLLEALKQ